MELAKSAPFLERRTGGLLVFIVLNTKARVKEFRLNLTDEKHDLSVLGIAVFDYLTNGFQRVLFTEADSSSRLAKLTIFIG